MEVVEGQLPEETKPTNWQLIKQALRNYLERKSHKCEWKRANSNEIHEFWGRVVGYEVHYECKSCKKVKTQPFRYGNEY